MSEKTEKLIKLRKLEKQITEKTEPNPIREKKPSQTGKTEPNWFEPVLSKKTEPNRDRLV